LKLRLFLLCAALCHAPAWAERADREKPVHIESDLLNVDDAKQVAVFEGKVVLTQGTFVLKSNKLIMRKDAEGFQYATATGTPATFREKREGADEWIDGEALRVEYDGKREFLELFDNARLTRGKDEVRGPYITYDPRADYYTVQSSKGGPITSSNKPKDTRVRATIQPKSKPDPAATPVELRPAPRIESPAR
jgi:lipopolysaccharide export system protein LptA